MAVRNIEHYQNMTTLMFDLRIVPGMTEESVRQDMTALLESIAAEDPEFHYELIIPQSPQQPNMPAREATPVDAPVAEALIRSHTAHHGQAASRGRWPSHGGDGGYLPL